MTKICFIFAIGMWCVGYAYGTLLFFWIDMTTDCVYFNFILIFIHFILIIWHEQRQSNNRLIIKDALLADRVALVNAPQLRILRDSCDDDTCTIVHVTVWVWNKAMHVDCDCECVYTWIECKTNGGKYYLGIWIMDSIKSWIVKKCIKVCSIAGAGVIDD